MIIGLIGFILAFTGAIVVIGGISADIRKQSKTTVKIIISGMVIGGIGGIISVFNLIRIYPN